MKLLHLVLNVNRFIQYHELTESLVLGVVLGVLVILLLPLIWLCVRRNRNKAVAELRAAVAGIPDGRDDRFFQTFFKF